MATPSSASAAISDAEPTAPLELSAPDTPYYTITTPRLLVRSAVPSDADATSALFAEQANFPFDPLNKPTPTPAEYRKSFAKWHASAVRGENAFMVVERRTDGALIGFSGWNSLSYVPVKEVESGHGATKEDEEQREPPANSSSTLDETSGAEEASSVREEPTSSSVQDVPKEDKSAVVDVTIPQDRVGNTGIVIDHRYWRLGYAREAFCATVEFGFAELGLARIELDTAKENHVWRTFMSDGLGLGHTERTRPSCRKKDDWEYVYEFDRRAWETVKQTLQAQGKWLL